jgi:hypothetical protein
MHKLAIPLALIVACTTCPWWSSSIWAAFFLFCGVWNIYWESIIVADPIEAKKKIMQQYKFKRAEDVGRGVGIVIFLSAFVYAYIGLKGIPFAAPYSLPFFAAMYGLIGKIAVAGPWLIDISKMGDAPPDLLKLVLGDFAFAIPFTLYLVRTFQ